VGVHFCLGAPLARAQLNALFRAMATRCKGFSLEGTVERSSSVLFHGARTLPIRLDPA
jgi:cytochrome P450